MKKIILSLLLVIVLGALAVVYTVSQVPEAPVHYHANFAVFEDGKQVDFTSPSLMHISPCTDSDDHSDDPKENVHLHDQIGNVVHLHMDGISWRLFLSTIKYDINSRAQGRVLNVYSKGQKVDSTYLDQTIRREDQILIHIASRSAQERVQDDPLLLKESESIGDNASEYDAGRIGIEKCGSTGKRTLWQRLKLALHQ